MIHSENTVGISLVEKDTTVGDGLLVQGSFIMAIANRRDVIAVRVDDVGPGTTIDSQGEFIDGPSLDLGSEIRGMDLAEDEIVVGGHTVPAGAILLTLNNDDTNGVGENRVPADSADVFYLTVTETGSNPIADATLLFEGADVNLDTSQEHVQALSLTNSSPVAEVPPPGYLDEFGASICGPEDYSGSDGAEDWSAWVWDEGLESDGSCAGLVQIVEDPVVSEPGNYRLLLDEFDSQALRTLDLSGYASATLSFDYRLENYSSFNDNLAVLVSGDGGGVWAELQRLAGNHTTYQGATYDISSYIGTDTIIGFATRGASTSQAAYVDNVHVAEGSGGGGKLGPSNPSLGGGATYVEANDLWYPSSSDTWETVNLASHGVPANAVVEVAIMNNNGSAQRWAGARSVGSSLDRRLQLHEAEGGGNDVVVMHVQADASSRIQTYADATNNILFILLGYWTGANYVETFDSFSAGGSNSWLDHNLGSYGVGANQVAEIAIVNTNTSSERLAGVRPTGTSMQRRFNIHEAESGGVDTVSLMVETDASAIAQVYASSNSDLDFYLVGYWSTPPGTYTSKGGSHSQITASSTWHQWDLSSFGVPANSIAQIVMTNEGDTAEQEMGVRRIGSSDDRVLDLQEAEAGGSDNAAMHVIVDGNSSIEAYSESGATDRYFYPVGWWVL